MKKSKLGSRIVSWFRNVRLGYKLAIVYALSGFLPVVAVLSVTYVQMKQILLQNERDSMESYRGINQCLREFQILQALAVYLQTTDSRGCSYRGSLNASAYERACNTGSQWYKL